MERENIEPVKYRHKRSLNPLYKLFLQSTENQRGRARFLALMLPAALLIYAIPTYLNQIIYDGKLDLDGKPNSSDPSSSLDSPEASLTPIETDIETAPSTEVATLRPLTTIESVIFVGGTQTPTATATSTETPTQTTTPTPIDTSMPIYVTDIVIGDVNGGHPIQPTPTIYHLGQTATSTPHQTETSTPTNTPTSTSTYEPTFTNTPTETQTAVSTSTFTSTPEGPASTPTSDSPTPTYEPTQTNLPPDTPTPSPIEADTAVPTSELAPPLLIN